MAKTRASFSLVLPVAVAGISIGLLSACVSGRDYSIADTAPRAAAADASEDQQAADRIVFTPGPDGTLQVQPGQPLIIAAAQTQVLPTTRYAVGTLSFANLALSANATTAAGVPLAAVNGALAGGAVNSTASVANLLTASFSTQSVIPSPSGTVTGGVSAGGTGGTTVGTGTGGSTSIGGSAGTGGSTVVGTVGGVAGGVTGGAGTGTSVTPPTTTPPVITPPSITPPSITPPSITPPSITPVSTAPTGPTGVTGGGLAALTPHLPH